MRWPRMHNYPVEDRPSEEQQKEATQWAAMGCLFWGVFLVGVLGIALGLIPFVILGPLLAVLFGYWLRAWINERAARRNYERRIAREMHQREEEQSGGDV